MFFVHLDVESNGVSSSLPWEGGGLYAVPVGSGPCLHRRQRRNYDRLKTRIRSEEEEEELAPFSSAFLTRKMAFE